MYHLYMSFWDTKRTRKNYDGWIFNSYLFNPPLFSLVSYNCILQHMSYLLWFQTYLDVIKSNKYIHVLKHIYIYIYIYYIYIHYYICPYMSVHCADLSTVGLSLKDVTVSTRLSVLFRAWNSAQRVRANVKSNKKQI